MRLRFAEAHHAELHRGVEDRHVLVLVVTATVCSRIRPRSGFRWICSGRLYAFLDASTRACSNSGLSLRFIMRGEKGQSF